MMRWRRVILAVILGVILTLLVCGVCMFFGAMLPGAT
jgi:hypothetical protein